MSAVALAITAAITGAIGVAGGAVSSSQSAKQARIEAAKARRHEKKLEQLERMRPPVIDQSQKIRDLKSQVFNPYEQMGVAMKGVEIQLEQQDQDLANTLDAINKSGTSAGGATALARAAAEGKAKVAASIENQEAANQKLKITGEANRLKQQMDLEQLAIAEEVNAFGRQEARDIAKLDRTSGLMDQSNQNATDLFAAGQNALISGVTSGLQSGVGVYASGAGSGGAGTNAATGLNDVNVGGGSSPNASAAGSWSGGKFKPFSGSGSGGSGTVGGLSITTS